MKKLKCWKKIERSKAGGVDTTFFRNKKTEDQIRVIGKTPKGEFYVAIEKNSPFSIDEIRGSKSKDRKKVLNRAYDYMKKHDRC